jgi:signal transduction histidine kinase
MDALRRVQDQSRQAAFLFAAVAIVLLVIGLDRLTRRFVHAPLGAVLGTMAHASAGDLAARAPRVRQDEIGAVAEGLNGLLERMGGFNETLRSEVARATEELRASNEALRATAQRLFDARRELAQSQRLALAGQMAASVAHQVGTPLNVISGYVQLLKAGQDAGSPTPRGCSRSRSRSRASPRSCSPCSTARGGRRSACARSRRASSSPGSRSSCAPRSWVTGSSSCSRSPRPAARRRGSRAARAGALEPGEQRGRRDAFGRTAEAGGATPRLGVTLVVADSGDGILAEDLPRVFDPLYTTKPPGKGTGLGLAILREVVEAHGGSVELESRTGEGTTALVCLPAAAGEA